MNSDGFTIKTPDGRTLRFVPAPLDVECVDVWPPERLSEAAQGAYDSLIERGRITAVEAHRDGVGRIYVRYMADCPVEWIREELREAKYRGRQMELTEVKK